MRLDTQRSCAEFGYNEQVNRQVFPFELVKRLGDFVVQNGRFSRRAFFRKSYALPILASLCVPRCAGVLAQTATGAAGGKRIFLIGNSLTWDCVPAALSGDVSWHVDCGKNLEQIRTKPDAPCVPSSKIWSQHLKTQQYDVLCVQPHYGTTLKQDAEAIAYWCSLQPNAELILHTGWARQSDWQQEYHGSDASKNSSTSSDGGARSSKPEDRPMVHSPDYFAALREAILEARPRTVISSTKAMQAIDRVRHDVQAGHAPISSIAELYRDNIHLSLQVGRYLAHNLMRQSLGQPLSIQGFQIEPDVQKYFDTIVRAIHSEPRKT